jgi:hypothetical protein
MSNMKLTVTALWWSFYGIVEQFSKEAGKVLGPKYLKNILLMIFVVTVILYEIVDQSFNLADFINDIAVNLIVVRLTD